MSGIICCLEIFDGCMTLVENENILSNILSFIRKLCLQKIYVDSFHIERIKNFNRMKIITFRKYIKSNHSHYQTYTKNRCL